MISANWFSSISGMWRWAVGGGLTLCLAMAVVVNQVQTEKADKQKNVQEAFEIVASVDSDSDSSSSTSWQDSSL
jgi:predicted membrane GTPase involved in stress response